MDESNGERSTPDEICDVQTAVDLTVGSSGEVIEGENTEEGAGGMKGRWVEGRGRGDFGITIESVSVWLDNTPVSEVVADTITVFIAGNGFGSESCGAATARIKKNKKNKM